MDDTKRVGHRIRERRERLGLSQRDVVDAMQAEQPGFRQPDLSTVENGRRVPTDRTLARLARVLDTTMDYLRGKRRV